MITTDLLSIEEIRRHLTAATVGSQIYLYGEVDSTNAKLLGLARGRAAEGAVVLAEGQTAGRGRRGQRWFSPAGVNLYASVLLRPAVPARELGVFSFIASLALADAVKDAGAVPAIKWPNDVLVDGRKVGGTLVECGLRGGAIDYVIIGVGVNLNVERAVLHAALGRAGLFATSLAAELGHDVDRNAFAAAWLNALDRWARTWAESGPAAVLAAWRSLDIVAGRRVEVRANGEGYEGRAIGVDAAGNMMVDDTLGTRHTLTSEELRIAD
jgi:BirA family biotin operon repressor/biotin-[acetyl-CoA-carboxylase] ligase